MEGGREGGREKKGKGGVKRNKIIRKTIGFVIFFIFTFASILSPVRMLLLYGHITPSPSSHSCHVYYSTFPFFHSIFGQDAAPMPKDGKEKKSFYKDNMHVIHRVDCGTARLRAVIDLRPTPKIQSQ